MAPYANADQLYAAFEALITALKQEHPQAVRAVENSRLTIRLTITDLQAQINLNAKRRPIAVSYGPASGRADLEIRLSAETLHQILLGRLSLAKAVGSQQLQLRGPIFKIMPLADLFNQAQTLYPGILQAQGLS